MIKSLPYNEIKGCPVGYHKRSSYTSKLGHRVPPRCVKAQTIYAENRKQFTRRVLNKQSARLQSIGKLKSATRKITCPKGYITRRGYVRRFAPDIINKGYTVHKKNGKAYRIYPERSSVYVKPSCIKDLGLPGKIAPGEGIGPLHKGELKKHGYIYDESIKQRQDALKKAIEEFGPLGVYHKLDAIAKLSTRSVPAASKVFTEDRDWLKAQYKLQMK